jgi:hypothetical protein
MKYFSLSELTHSDTAVSVRIDNTPTAAAVPLMVELIDRVLDPIREHWGLPIRVTSGYRCPELNEEVGGVEDSYHMDGCAADITALGNSEEHRRHRNIELMSLIRTMHLTGKIALTECYAGPDYKYIHVAYSPANIDESPFI